LDDTSELRALAPTDAPALFKLVDANRARLREWLPWLDLNRKLEDSVSFIGMTVKKDSDRQGVTGGIWHAGRLVGVAGQHVVDWANKKVSLGYWISQDAEGKGLVGKATAALIDYSVNDLNLNRVEIRVATGNTRSARVAERLGFEPEGVARESEWLYDRFVDHRVYALLAKDWKKRG
jgi:ribosomal-protein-serine acetyltransferase